MNTDNGSEMKNEMLSYYSRVGWGQVLFGL
jgi:hypothetical protein